MKLKKTRVAALALIALVAVAVVGCDWLSLVIDFPTDPTANISIAVVWNTDQDLDAHFTYPINLETTPGANPAELMGTSDFSAYPDFITHTVTHVYYGNKQQTLTGVFAKQYKDQQTGPGTESISLFGDAIAATGGRSITVDSSSPDGLGKFLTAGTYYWMGYGTFYVDSFSGSLATQAGASADAYVVMKQGSTVIMKVRLPENTNLETCSAVRVHMLNNATGTQWYLVVYPMLEFVDGTTMIKGGAAPIAVVSGTR